MEEEESLALPTLSPRLSWRSQREEEREEGRGREAEGGKRNKKKLST